MFATPSVARIAGGCSLFNIQVGHIEDWPVHAVSLKDYEFTPPPDRLADRAWLRTAFSTERGTVTKFMTQLEYWLEGDWHEVVRYDPDADT